MDMKLKEQFESAFSRYFPGGELPLAYYYSDECGELSPLPHPSGHRCFIGDLKRVRNGRSACFGIESMGCMGGKRYTGFTQEISPTITQFLSSGIPGKVHGERYKKSPELAKTAIDALTHYDAPVHPLIVKRWDNLTAEDKPDVVAFFATPDVLSGLFTLVNFDEDGLHGVLTPFTAGCGAIVHHPMAQIGSSDPKAILGMFDVSARPFVEAGVLTLAVPMARFQRMVANMDESFLITPAWGNVSKRMAQKPDA